MQILFCFSGHFLFTCIYKIITFTRINIAIASIEKENIELQIKKKFLDLVIMNTLLMFL